MISFYNQYPLQNAAYIITGGINGYTEKAVQLATTLRNMGIIANILDTTMGTYGKYGIMYYHNVDAEEARVKALEAAKAAEASKASTQKK